jgi:S1-C subfamily serine protease
MARHTRISRIGTGLAAALLILTGCTDSSSSPKATPSSTGAAAAESIPDLVARIEPSVVTIVTGEGLGSGVVYKPDGTVLTNAHVVGNARDVQVAFADGTRVAGHVVAVDTVTDLAVVRAARTGLPAVTLRVQLPRPGELVLAMGSPLGFENSVTEGIISGVNRQIPGSARQGHPLVDLLQTDAAISPGNSGGALVDGSGKLVGINEAYIPPSAGAVSLGFAIPAATVQDVADQLIATGHARHPYLGLTIAQVTPNIAAALHLPVNAGVLVQAVAAGGPADKAGIRPGDVITEFNGTSTPTVEDLYGALRKTNPGDSATVQIHRGNDTRTVTLTLGALGG